MLFRLPDDGRRLRGLKLILALSHSFFTGWLISQIAERPPIKNISEAGS